MQRCLLLAVLLHVWLVLVFGNATGTAAPGQGVWGSLTVKLLGRSGGEPGAPPGDPVREARDNGAAGENGQQRQGGQVRPTRTATAAPGAAELGRWNPREVPPEAHRTDEVSPAAPNTSTLELPEGFRPVERERLTLPAQAPPLQMPAVELPAAIGRLDARPDTTAPPLPSPASLRANRRAALPPVTADLPAPVRRLEAPTEAVAAPALPRPSELRSTAPALPSTSAALPAPVQRLEAPTAADGNGVAPLTRASGLRTPGDVTTRPTAMPDAQDLPAPVRRLEATDNVVTPLQPAINSPAPLAAPSATMVTEVSQVLPGQVATPADAAHGDPSANAYAPKASAGSPDAGSRLGPDLAVPPSASASAPRAPLNLSLPRSGDIASRRGPGLVELLPQPPERKSRLEQSIEDATNADCRKAYANAGLLAAVPLVLDAARGKGCKW